MLFILFGLAVGILMGFLTAAPKTCAVCTSKFLKPESWTSRGLFIFFVACCTGTGYGIACIYGEAGVVTETEVIERSPLGRVPHPEEQHFLRSADGRILEYCVGALETCQLRLFIEAPEDQVQIEVVDGHEAELVVKERRIVSVPSIWLGFREPRANHPLYVLRVPKFRRAAAAD